MIARYAMGRIHGIAISGLEPLLIWARSNNADGGLRALHVGSTVLGAGAAGAVRSAQTMVLFSAEELLVPEQPSCTRLETFYSNALMCMYSNHQLVS